jgi:8-oxo-dGTP pyrophosphatase MutT (NUDIX family)
MNENAVFLTQVERQRGFPNVRPRDAATLILIDRAKKTPRVLMGKRHHGHKFMPGKFVFPGGRIEPADRAMVCANALPAASEQKLMARVQRPSPLKARALALAAIRETFEETGLALGSLDHGAPDAPPEGPWRDFATHGVFPDLERMQFIARAITPPRRPKRFDTRFFAADAAAIAAQIDGIVHDGAELTELTWVTLKEARALDLPSITQVILKELEARIAAGFLPELPVPFYYERFGTFRREEL